VLFCVLPVCYDARLSHLNKDYLLTYLKGRITSWRIQNKIACRTAV